MSMSTAQAPHRSRLGKFRRHKTSIRLSLTLWYVGVWACVLAIFTVILYSILSTGMGRQLDQTLRSHAEGVESAISAYWRGESELGNWMESPQQPLKAAVREGKLSEVIAAWAQATRMLETARPFRILDHGGNVLAASWGFEGLESLTPELVTADEASRHPVHRTHKTAESRIRFLTHPAVEDGEGLYYIQTGGLLNRVDAARRELRLWLFLLVPPALAIAVLVGWLVASTALHPINRMIRQAQRISAESLFDRIDVPKTGDELERLAVTFNGLLSRIENSFERIRRFSAAASHELRTPLTVMRGEVELALRSPRSPKEYQDLLRLQLGTVEEMTEVVGELLTLARTDGSEGVMRTEPVELTTMMERLKERWMPIARKAKVQMEVETDGAAWVEGDAKLLNRLISNLVDNAVRYTPPHGTITIKVEAQEDIVSLRVQDSGPGIPESKLAHIFNGITSPRSDAPKDATGIGLGLCRWITEVHRGRMDVTSHAGQGTLCTVWLPRLDRS
ncbi:MAG: HAMP domain-containing protein [Candidatus Omnitrophica bacterium]|nr:HAMP domain-containing protein [Candidatus Omnitrophota bacterium]